MQLKEHLSSETLELDLADQEDQAETQRTGVIDGSYESLDALIKGM